MDKQQLSAKLGVSHTAIYRWIDRFGDFFSEGAKASRREYTQADLDMLATIAKLSHDGLKYDAIEKRLLDGERVSFENTTFGTDSRMIPAAAVEQIIDSVEIKTELAQIKAERDKLIELVEKADAEKRDLQSKVDQLQSQIADLQNKLGRAEGRLEEKDKRRRWF